jgi:hypothetical protein
LNPRGCHCGACPSAPRSSCHLNPRGCHCSTCPGAPRSSCPSHHTWKPLPGLALRASPPTPCAGSGRRAPGNAPSQPRRCAACQCLATTPLPCHPCLLRRCAQGSTCRPATGLSGPPTPPPPPPRPSPPRAQGATSWLTFYLLESKGAPDPAAAALRVSGLELGGLVGGTLSGILSDVAIRRAKGTGEGLVGKRVQIVMVRAATGVSYGSQGSGALSLSMRSVPKLWGADADHSSAWRECGRSGWARWAEVMCLGFTWGVQCWPCAFHGPGLGFWGAASRPCRGVWLGAWGG